MGAPHGNKNSAQGKAWRDALRRAIREAYAGEDFDVALAKLAGKLVKETDGENSLGALREIGDRLDGKPAQQVELTGEGGGPLEFRWKGE